MNYILFLVLIKFVKYTQFSEISVGHIEILEWVTNLAKCSHVGIACFLHSQKSSLIKKLFPNSFTKKRLSGIQFYNENFILKARDASDKLIQIYSFVRLGRFNKQINYVIMI
jgi:hypothetical protein